MSAFLVRRVLPLEAVGELAGELAQVRAAAVLASTEDAPVSCLYSMFVPAERTCFSAIDAPSLEAVLEVLRRGGVAGDVRVRPAVRFDDLPRQRSRKRQP